MNTIGERIKRRREELNMSQEELATKLGYKSRSSINKIEKDGRELRQNKIADIAKALDTTPSYIMGWDDDPFLKTASKNYGNNKMAQIIINKQFKINQRDEKDIYKRLDETLELLESQQEALMFDGQAMDDTTRELLRVSLENSLKMGKINAKEKYTPKKYKQD